MAAVSTTAKIPSPVNLSDRLHQGENWKSFRCERKFYELAAGIQKITRRSGGFAVKCYWRRKDGRVRGSTRYSKSCVPV